MPNPIPEGEERAKRRLVCPDCGKTFPQTSGPHPTWISCGEPKSTTAEARVQELEKVLSQLGRCNFALPVSAILVERVMKDAAKSDPEGGCPVTPNPSMSAPGLPELILWLVNHRYPEAMADMPHDLKTLLEGVESHHA